MTTLFYIAFALLLYYAAGLQIMLWIDRRWHAGEARSEVVMMGALIWLPVLVIQAVVALREKIRRSRL